MGEAINIRGGSTVYLNEASVVTADIIATNGVVHVLSAPIYPSAQRTAYTALTADQGTYSSMLSAFATQAACAGVTSISSITQASTFGGTVFSPNNDAFTSYGNLAALSCAQLNALLTYSVIATQYALADLTNGMQIQTLSPVTAPVLGRRLLQSQFESLTVWRPPGSSDVYVNNAKILSSGTTSNGNVLQLDALVIPPSQQDVVQVAQARPASFTSLVTFIQAAGMTTSLKKPFQAASTSSEGFPGFTIFAPTDSAFASSPFLKDYQALLAAAQAGNTGGLQELLWNHVVYGVWPTPLVSGTVMRSINGLEISITTSDGTDGRAAGTYANNVLISDVNGVQATNGRVHTVAGVISGQLSIPSSAIVPTSISRTPQGICPEYGSILRNSAGVATATATLKLAADLQSATITIISQATFSQIELRQDVNGVSTQVAVSAFDTYSAACAADVTKCVSQSTMTIPMNTQLMGSMDNRKVTLYVSLSNAAAGSATLVGTVPRLGCYEATLGGTAGKGMALAMVDDTAATYAFGAPNSNNKCPAGTAPITTAADCQLAASALRVTTDPIASNGTNYDGTTVSAITDNSWPQGCFFYEGTDATGASSTKFKKVYFSSRTVGMAGVPSPYVGTQKPLCVAASSGAGGIIFQLNVKDLPTGGTVNLVRVFGDIADPNLVQSVEANLKVTIFDASDSNTANSPAGLNQLNQPFVYTGTDVSRFVQGFQIGSYALHVRASITTGASTTTGVTVGYFFPAVSCPSLTGFALNKYLVFKTDSLAEVLTQARLDTYYREVLISVRVIRAPLTDITSVDIMGPAALGSDAQSVRLSIKVPPNFGGPIIQKRFRLTAMDIVNFQQGLMYANVRTVRYPNGELRGQYQTTTCYSVTIVPPDAGNTVFGQVQVSPDGTEAFINVFGNGVPGATASNPFQLNRDSTRVSLLNADLPHLDGIVKTTALLLPGATPPPTALGEMPFTRTFGVTQVLRDALLLGSVSLAGKVASSPTGTASIVSAAIRISTVLDPRRYVVQDGDTLESIAAANKFDSWVPLQMINRLSAPYNLVAGQVLDLCYRHRVASSETIYDIARKYGLSYTELFPMNPHLFDSEFIFAGQEVCVMPAMKRIMCGAPAQVVDSTGLRGNQGRSTANGFSVGAAW